MDLKKFKIADLDKSQQTDAIKTELLNMIKQFVFKVSLLFIPSFKGFLFWIVLGPLCRFSSHLRNIVMDKVSNSELDRFDPGQMGGEDWKGTLGWDTEEETCCLCAAVLCITVFIDKAFF